jgi:hypothetical protein
MNEYRDINKPPLGVLVKDAVMDPRFFVANEDGGESIMLLMFSETHGWITYAIPRKHAQRMRELIGERLAERQSPPALQ